MRRSLLLTLVIGFGIVGYSQNFVKHSNVQVTHHWKVNLSELEDLQIVQLKQKSAAPKPATTADKVKAKLDAQRRAKEDFANKTNSYVTTSEDVRPFIDGSFNGKQVGGAGIPNDNTMAISNGGMIVSAINTNVHIYKSDGTMVLFRTLAGIVKGQLGLLDRTYDPKVTYDPITDRFILVFLEGSTSDDTRIVVGFSETNDPSQTWNFYALNGRPFGGTQWSDYPIIAHNKEDLYITVNLLRDNESWQEGFIQSLIWQVQKQGGYDGDTALVTNVFSDITYNDKSVWSICPVQPALDFNHDNMYLLSVRPDAESNDTVFLHEITNTVGSGLAEHKLTVLTSDTKYGVAPTAYQKDVGISLQTNDTRVLSGSYVGGNIHYTQTTLVPDQLSSGIYHGIINDVKGNQEVSANIISSDKLDYAYPSIAFAGTKESQKHSMLITFSHSGIDDYPGTSVVFHNKKLDLGSLYSPVVSIKQGEGRINTFLADSMERWGDYTDIQPKYDEPGVVWLCGSYGDENERNNVWLAEVKVDNQLVTSNAFITYPNPADKSIYVDANLGENDNIEVRLVDMKGVIVKKLESQFVKAGNFEFLITTDGISSGAYVVSIINEAGERLYHEKVIVE